MSSRPLRSRWTSRSIKRAISGSFCASVPEGIEIVVALSRGAIVVCGIKCPGFKASVSRLLLSRIDLFHSTLVATPFKFSIQPRLHGLHGCLLRHEASGEYQNVGIIVLPR